MARKIAYIGFGSLGKQIATLVRQSGTEAIEEIYFDDLLFKDKAAHSFPFDAHLQDQFRDYEFFVCLGYKQLAAKQEVVNTLLGLKRNLPVFIHPSCIINPESTIEAGSVLYPGCNIDQHVTIRPGALLNNGVIVSHDSIIGSNCFLAPGAIVSGEVKIGEQCFIGAGTVISNGISIGDNVIVGPATLVTSDIPAGRSVIGNPMRILDKKLTIQ